MLSDFFLLCEINTRNTQTIETNSKIEIFLVRNELLTRFLHHAPRFEWSNEVIDEDHAYLYGRRPIVFNFVSACVMNNASMNRRNSWEQSSDTIREQKDSINYNLFIWFLVHSKITLTNRNDRALITIEQMRTHNTSFFFKFKKITCSSICRCEKVKPGGDFGTPFASYIHSSSLRVLFLKIGLKNCGFVTNVGDSDGYWRTVISLILAFWSFRRCRSIKQCYLLLLHPITLVRNTNILDYYLKNIQESMDNLLNVDREAYYYSSMFYDKLNII